MLDQPLRSFVDMANRNECFSDFSRQRPAKERWHSLVSRMGDREEYLETPFPLPPSLYGRSFARSLARSVVRWRHNQIFSAWWVINFSFPWCFAGALRALKLCYKINIDYVIESATYGFLFTSCKTLENELVSAANEWVFQSFATSA